ncbi:prepilin-type N-terminal cleavage/methylation domain-containing protein [bacterium]|nr:prepilin-type N-terminal cleavage/methylation domain-containing protein [bacterium]
MKRRNPFKPVALKHGFTLLELLVVIGIIAVLASILLPVVNRAREEGRKTACIQTMRQIYLAVSMYKDDYNNYLPPWLSNLYPSYIGTNKKIYLCLSDTSKGTEGGKPDWHQDQYSETDDTSSNTTAPGRDPQITACSYLYEFCGATCTWFENSYVSSSSEFIEADTNNDGTVTWNEAKKWQMKSYMGPKIPIVRCFWHTRSPLTNDDIVLNMSYDGNLTISGPEWETTTH